MTYNQSALLRESREPFQPDTHIYFCPDGAASRRITRSEFSPQKKLAIRNLHALDKRWNLVILLHYAIWLTTAILAVRSQSLLIDLVLYTIGGLSLSTLSVLAHESSHNLLTRKPAIDRVLGFFCGLPVLFSVAGYRVVHPLHHKFLHSERDPDDIENVSANPSLLRFVYLFVFLAGIYLYLVTVPLNALRKGTREERVSVVVEWLAMMLIAGVSWMILPSRLMLKGWIYPLLLAGQIANLRGIAEHGLTTGGNELTDTRTVTTHPALAFMMCNINFHLEHHLYPGIPWYNLPRLHVLLHDEYLEAGS
jgi:fatty acid desaturase